MTENNEYIPEDIEVSADRVSEAEVFHKPGPNKRVCAFLIDSMLINLLYWKLNLLVGGWGPFVLLYLYLLFRDSFGGSGPGKLIVGLRVMEDDGRPLSILKSFIRNSTMLLVPFQLVEYFVMLHDPRGKRLGDRMARTAVTDTKPHLKDKVFLLISIAVLLVSLAVSVFAAPRGGGGNVCPLRTRQM